MKITSIDGNSQRLDGGAMFGNAPKAVWKKWLEPDEQNNIALSCRCCLIEIDGNNSEGPRKILLETGIGNFFPPKLKARYGVQEDDHILIKSLENLGIKTTDITDIIVSHLHFDHAGGLLNSFREDHPLEMAFPNAHFYFGNEAYNRAKHPHPRDKASFIPELPTLLENSGRLHLIKNSTHPNLPTQLSFMYSNGHTPGLTLTRIQGSQNEMIFVSDLIPGTPWVHLPITMGYDRYPELLIDEKKKLLDECVQKNIYLFYTHDPIYACSKVKQEDNKFSFVDGKTNFKQWVL